MTTAPTTDVFATLPPIFREACDPTWGLPRKIDLSTPWVYGGYIVASDGRIMVRLGCHHAGVDPATFPIGGRRPKDPLTFFDDPRFTYDPTPLVLPDDLPPEREDCPECNGTGKGERDPSGAFAEDCHFCEGDRTFPNTDAVEVVPGYFLAARYCGLLKRHGAVLSLPVNDPLRPARFRVALPERGTIIEGLVMPMKPPEDRR